MLTGFFGILRKRNKPISGSYPAPALQIGDHSTIASCAVSFEAKAENQRVGWCQNNGVPIMAHTNASNGPAKKFDQLIQTSC